MFWDSLRFINHVNTLKSNLRFIYAIAVIGPTNHQKFIFCKRKPQSNTFFVSDHAIIKPKKTSGENQNTYKCR